MYLVSYANNLYKVNQTKTIIDQSFENLASIYIRTISEEKWLWSHFLSCFVQTTTTKHDDNHVKPYRDLPKDLQTFIVSCVVVRYDCAYLNWLDRFRVHEWLMMCIGVINRLDDWDEMRWGERRLCWCVCTLAAQVKKGLG